MRASVARDGQVSDNPKQQVDIRVIQVLLGHKKLDYLPRQTMSHCAASLQ
jgi:hypothetical protein